jgi:hypothetical protein
MSRKLVISIVVIIVASIAAKLAYNYLSSESSTVSFEETDWLQREYLGVQFESPFELSVKELELPPSVQEFVKTMQTYAYDSKSISLFIGLCEYKEGTPVNIDGAVDGAMQNMKKEKDVSDFKYDVIPFSTSSQTGRLITGTFKIKKQEAEFVAKFYSRDTKFLQIICLNLSNDANREASGRIMKTMKVNL